MFFFFFNDTATTEIYTLSLHDALPISSETKPGLKFTMTTPRFAATSFRIESGTSRDRKSTRLNSSHLGISYAVFCLKKKKIATCRSMTVHHRPCYPLGSSSDETRLRYG